MATTLRRVNEDSEALYSYSGLKRAAGTMPSLLDMGRDESDEPVEFLWIERSGGVLNAEYEFSN